MRKLIGGICLLFFMACHKSPTTSSTPAMQYKINGEQVQITGALDSTNLDANTGYYYGCYATKFNGSNFYSISGENKNYAVLLGIATTQDSLLAITYSGGAVDVSFTINDTAYGINNGDGMSVNISRYSNGTIDGTFSGTISSAASVKKTITDGKFNNLKVR